MGRPTDYTLELADTICERIANGDSLRFICQSDEFPNKSTVFKWLGRYKEFNDQYARAKEEQAELFADELITIADMADSTSSTDISHAKLKIDTRKWVASKLKPKKYGDKLDVDGTLNHTGTIDVVQRIIIDHATDTDS